MSRKEISRREFIRQNIWTGLGAAVSLGVTPALLAGRPTPGGSRSGTTEPIIDMHQHTDYHGRTNRELVNHQRAMGISTTVLLPAWRPDDDLTGRAFIESG
ncbi:MAG: hypothetical protein R3281_16335, partial [Balneolaceae bacterium]|nr:hypothetical protein [Balneolaceae bacterium]